VFFRGMTERELNAWTGRMLHSGEVLDLSEVPGVKIDKHSTGGVGDKCSFILAPIAAACGVVVPMISGRGLGHTGGTLDKLESIPGFDVNLSAARFTENLRSIGIAMIGQTGELAPADKRLYALRDVTGTVESIPLIASSIMSKKLAAGIDGLVLDVKVGRGAFMKTAADARRLARTMVAIGRRMGKRMTALLTDMSQPLGTHVGNSLEIIESLEILKGRVDNDCARESFELAAQMLVLGRRAASLFAARAKVAEAVKSGAALGRFKEMIAAQGGDPRVTDDYGLLPAAKHVRPIAAAEKGFVTAIDAEEVGLAAMTLGAGRETVDSRIDHATGIVLHKKVGDAVKKGEALCTIHFNDGPATPDRLAAAEGRVSKAFTVGPRRAPPPKLLKEIIR